MALIIAVEGLPASGKTTIIRMMTEDLQQTYGLRIKTVDIETTGHSPGLRAIAREYPLGHPIRILLFWVLRLQQYDAIQEELAKKVDVIFADRFWGSTIAFDVYGNGAPYELLKWIGRHIKRQPDFTLFFDAPLDIVKKRKEVKTMDNPDFAKRVEYGYKELAEKLSWVRVDATQKPEEVKDFCLKFVLSKL